MLKSLKDHFINLCLTGLVISVAYVSMIGSVLYLGRIFGKY